MLHHLLLKEPAVNAGLNLLGNMRNSGYNKAIGGRLTSNIWKA